MTHSLDNNIIPFLAVIITYFGLLTYIGYYATKQTRTLRDYFTMSGKAGALLSGLAYFSTQYSMSTFMGVPGTIYKVGYAGMSVSVPGIAFSMVIPALLVGRRLIRLGHRYRMLTMADYISDRYESTLMRALLAIIMILFLVPMMGAQTIGAGIIFKTYTGSLQLGGGMEVINQHLADTDISLLSHPGQNNSMPWQNYVSMIIMWSFFTIGQPHLFTKFFTMKNYNVMFKAVLLGTLGMWFSATLIEWCGVTGRMSFPNLTGTDTDFIVPLILQAGVHPVISSLMVAGIFSAGMSTVSGVLITSTSAVTRDLYQKIFNKEATDKDAFIMSRYVTVGLGVLAICIGIYKPSSIFQLVLFSFGGLGIWAAPILAGLYWKRATKVGAFASVIVGEIVYILLTTTFTSLTFGFNPLIVAWIIAMVVLIVVSLCTKPASAETIRRHFDDLEKC